MLEDNLKLHFPLELVAVPGIIADSKCLSLGELTGLNESYLVRSHWRPGFIGFLFLDKGQTSRLKESSVGSLGILRLSKHRMQRVQQ